MMLNWLKFALHNDLVSVCILDQLFYAGVTQNQIFFSLFQGLLNLSSCREKIQKKVDGAEEKLKTLQAEMTKPDYDKV